MEPTFGASAMLTAPPDPIAKLNSPAPTALPSAVVKGGQEITMVEAPETGGQVIDLMEALRASLQKAPAKRAPAAQPAKSAARKAAGKK